MRGDGTSAASRIGGEVEFLLVGRKETYIPSESSNPYAYQKSQ
jgi:hypothetical protein